MQRFTSLTIQTSRLFRAASVQYFSNKNGLTVENNVSMIQRCLSSKADKSTIDPAKLYKASTAKTKTHIPDELHEGQPVETIESITKNPVASGAKVWSNRDADSIHVAPLNHSVSPTSSAQDSHQATVRSTQGEVNIANPFKTQQFQPQVDAAKLAEVAATSAFEPFTADVPLSSTPIPEATFAPKISSFDLYSNVSSPTADFDSHETTGTSHESQAYESAARGKVFGGHDTSTTDKKHPKENPFNTHEKMNINQLKK